MTTNTINTHGAHSAALQSSSSLSSTSSTFLPTPSSLRLDSKEFSKIAKRLQKKLTHEAVSSYKLHEVQEILALSLGFKSHNHIQTFFNKTQSGPLITQSITASSNYNEMGLNETDNLLPNPQTLLVDPVESYLKIVTASEISATIIGLMQVIDCPLRKYEIKIIQYLCEILCTFRDKANRTLCFSDFHDNLRSDKLKKLISEHNALIGDYDDLIEGLEHPQFSMIKRDLIITFNNLEKLVSNPVVIKSLWIKKIDHMILREFWNNYQNSDFFSHQLDTLIRNNKDLFENKPTLLLGVLQGAVRCINKDLRDQNINMFKQFWENFEIVQKYSQELKAIEEKYSIDFLRNHNQLHVVFKHFSEKELFLFYHYNLALNLTDSHVGSYIKQVTKALVFLRDHKGIAFSNASMVAMMDLKYAIGYLAPYRCEDLESCFTYLEQEYSSATQDSRNFYANLMRALLEV